MSNQDKSRIEHQQKIVDNLQEVVYAITGMMANGDPTLSPDQLLDLVSAQKVAMETLIWMKDPS